MRSLNREEQYRACLVRLDRVRLVSWAPPGVRLPQMPGFKVISDRRVRPQGMIATYARVRELRSLASDTKVYWQYQRQWGWLRHWRITLVADDRTGLTSKDVKAITGQCRFFRFLLIELALDFE